MRAFAGPISADNSSQFRSPHLLHRAEMLQQRLNGLRADPFNLLQFTVDKGFAALLTVERYGKAVHLILDARQEVEQQGGRTHPTSNGG